MTAGSQAAPADPAGTAALARDWATIWQSELAAIAGDAETGLLLERFYIAWLGAASALDAVRSSARADAPPRAAAADAAAGARPAATSDADIAELRARIAALEQRLARNGGGGR